MSITNGVSVIGVSNCYVFKSRLQEYAQKAGLVTPVYETWKEGPSHEPYFRSTVTVDNVRYDSLPGFFNRKAAEQSAAEIALLEISKSGNMNESISFPVHETGLCKNLLQEYAQKMNFAIPSYTCQKKEIAEKIIHFSCTVEIGGIQYIGATAKTKKEAEIKAARTALLAIRSNAAPSEAQPSGSPQLTVLPCKKKVTEPETTHADAPKSLKPKKAGFKKKWGKKRFSKNKDDQVSNQASNNMSEYEVNGTENTSGMQVENSGTREATENGQGVVGKTSETRNGDPSSSFGQYEQGTSNLGILSGFEMKNLVKLAAEVDKVSGIGRTTQSSVAENTSRIGETARNVSDGELVHWVKQEAR
ncbi:hypothetical protein Sjap_017117 [Stephania japonica]|uniref:DRBM domain-containing protein n=1 Tax=Stephania japonica TaxID=461633 RepID=A0AAP0NHZ3_9MAGN